MSGSDASTMAPLAIGSPRLCQYPPVTQIADRLQRRIEEEGPVTFAAFMQEALYGAGGYYVADASPVGRDFVTGSSLSPLFGRATGRLLERLAEHLGGRADYLEAGFGGGQHLGAIAEVWSPESRGRFLGWDQSALAAPAGVESVADLGRVPIGSLEGMVFSYELFDALSVHRLVGGPDAVVRELLVGLTDDGDFRFQEAALSDPSLTGLLGDHRLEPGQIADVSAEWVPLYDALISRITRGLVVTCDYGFPRRRLFDPRVRANGTLACYRRHRVHRNPFEDVGTQDLTAHVDFTALREAGEALGWTTVAFSRQAMWLAAMGVFDELRGADATVRGEAMAILDGHGMGEEIRVLVQAKNVDPAAILDLEILGPLRSGVP